MNRRTKNEVPSARRGVEIKNGPTIQSPNEMQFLQAVEQSPGIVLLRCTFYVVALYPQEMQNCTILHIVTSDKRPPINLSPGRGGTFRPTHVTARETTDGAS